MKTISARRKFNFSEEEITSFRANKRSFKVRDIGFYFNGDKERPAGLYSLNGRHYGEGNCFDEYNLSLDAFKKTSEAYFVAAAKCVTICPGITSVGMEINKSVVSLTNQLGNII